MLGSGRAQRKNLKSSTLRNYPDVPECIHEYEILQRNECSEADRIVLGINARHAFTPYVQKDISFHLTPPILRDRSKSQTKWSL